MTETDMSHNDQTNDPAPVSKKPYATPRVVSYGHVKDIIQGGGGMKDDSLGAPPGGNSKTNCWIAEALYGEHDPRTLLLRAWLSDAYDRRRSGWMFIALYRKYGRRTAHLIQRGYLPKQLFHPLFDALVEKALDESAYAVVAARR
jgi:hypothetical protein